QPDRLRGFPALVLVVDEHDTKRAAACDLEWKADQRVCAHRRRDLELADLLLVEKDEDLLHVELWRFPDILPALEDQPGVRVVVDLGADLHDLARPDRSRQTDAWIAKAVAGHVRGPGAPAFRHADLLGRDEVPVSRALGGDFEDAACSRAH